MVNTVSDPSEPVAPDASEVEGAVPSEDLTPQEAPPTTQEQEAAAAQEEKPKGRAKKPDPLAERLGQLESQIAEQGQTFERRLQSASDQAFNRGRVAALTEARQSAVGRRVTELAKAGDSEALGQLLLSEPDTVRLYFQGQQEQANEATRQVALNAYNQSWALQVNALRADPAFKELPKDVQEKIAAPFENTQAWGRFNNDITIWQGEVMTALAEAKATKLLEKWKGEEMAEELDARDAEAKARARGEIPGPGPTGGKATGKPTFRTKLEARTLHVQGQISNAEMRRIDADPNIPEGQ